MKASFLFFPLFHLDLAYNNYFILIFNLNLLFIYLFSHNTKMTQYEHPAKTQFIQQQHQQEMRVSESERQESQAIPAQNPLVPANPYISEGMNMRCKKFS